MKGSRPGPGPSPVETPASAAWGLDEAMLWLVFLLPPLVFSARVLDSFRLPKLLVANTLALGSLAVLVWRLRDVPRLELGAFLRRPAVLAVAPLLAVATLGLATSAQPVLVRDALIWLWIGLACLLGWHLGLRREEQRRLLLLTLLPATLLAVIGIFQYHHLVDLFAFQGEVGARLGITSLAGGPFDLGAYLVLPVLIAQGWLAASRGGYRVAAALCLALCLYAAAATQTLTALLAIAAGSLVLWSRLVSWRRLAALGALAALLGGGLLLVLDPLRQRVERKVASVRSGDLDELTTGRLDGWKAALWMLRERPLTGVGTGAYSGTFAEAKLGLREAGVTFYRRQHQVFFDHAHSEVLEAAAEWGWPGVAALVWALGLLGRETVRAGRRCGESLSERAAFGVASGGLAALAVLALTSFALHLAHIAYPYLLLIAALFSAARPPTPAAGAEADAA